MTSARDTDCSGLSFSEALRFYGDLRKVLYDEMRVVFPGFMCSPISMRHAVEADGWVSAEHTASRSMWRWVDAHQYYNDKKRFKRYDIAINAGGNLLGLAYGMPSQAKTKLKVNILEGTPYKVHKKNTRIFELISESAQIYADLLGADEVRIMRPVNEDVANYYCSYGYEFVEPAGKNIPVYCSLKLRG